MTPPTERALEKQREDIARMVIGCFPQADGTWGPTITRDQALICERLCNAIARALDDERAAVWEEATKMVNELWTATVPLLPASFIGLGASISRRAGKSRPRRRATGGSP